MDSATGDIPSKHEKKAQLDDLIVKKKSEYMRLLQESQEHDPKSAEDLNHRKYELALAYNERGQVNYRMIEFDEAVEDYTEAIRYCDSLAAAYFNRGTVKYRMGYFDVALGDMEKAVSLDPTNKEFQLGLKETKAQLQS
ncbi:uncharacterized protein LOC119174405 [Rhipicephalus microplus]|uniref:uncharacterized protein LOC119174405 n=1 Tax=Rhipicephalus microplus TaxID=6941 RepID=UPI002376883F